MNFCSHKKMTLSATDEFWHSPIDTAADITATSATTDTSATTATPPTTISNTNNDYFDFVLPPAHRQFLCQGAQHQCTSYEDLKGYDHTQANVIHLGYDDAVDYDYDDDDYNDDDDDDIDACDSLDESLYCRRQTPMTMPWLGAKKQQGKTSWLMEALQRDELECDNDDVDNDRYMVPGLVRVPSGSSLESDDVSSSSSDSNFPTQQQEQPPPRRGVSFSSTVIIQPIPHSSTLTPAQRRKIYTTCKEARMNKIRNKREYRFEKCHWKNATEEWEMSVDLITGELVHPAHGGI